MILRLKIIEGPSFLLSLVPPGPRSQHHPRYPGVPLLHQHRHVRRGHAAPDAHAGARLRRRNHDRLHPQERSQLHHAWICPIPVAAQVVRPSTIILN